MQFRSTAVLKWPPRKFWLKQYPGSGLSYLSFKYGPLSSLHPLPQPHSPIILSSSSVDLMSAHLTTGKIEPDAAARASTQQHDSLLGGHQAPVTSSEINAQDCTEENTIPSRGSFTHPGARTISRLAEDGDGPYKCRKCDMPVLTVSVTQCPACLDNYPWFPPEDGSPGSLAAQGVAPHDTPQASSPGH